MPVTDDLKCKKCKAVCEKKRAGIWTYHICWKCKLFVIISPSINLKCWRKFRYKMCDCGTSVLEEPPFFAHVCSEQDVHKVGGNDGSVSRRLGDGYEMLSPGGDEPSFRLEATD